MSKETKETKAMKAAMSRYYRLLAREKRGPLRELGRVGRNRLGFESVRFRDANGRECGLTVSCLALLARPGASAVWLGCVPDPVSGPQRMHLARAQVSALIRHLQAWLKRDTLRLPKAKR